MHRNVLLWLLAIGLVLPLSPLEAAAGGQETVLVFADARERARLAVDGTVEVTQALPDALVVRLDPGRRAALEATGARVVALPDPHRVVLRTGEVDLRDVPLTRALAPRGKEAMPLLVVFDGVPVPAWIEGLESAGAAVAGPIPPASFLIYADEAAAAAVERLEGVTRVAPYLPEWKLDGRLVAGPARAPARMLVFPGADPDRVLARAADEGIALIGVEAFGRTLLSGNLSAADAASLAELPEVERIESAGSGGFYNNMTRVVMQTEKAHFLANTAFYNPVYGIGVWGASQTVTLADSGLNLPPLRHETFLEPGKIISNVAAGPCVTVLGDAAFGGLGHGTGVATTLLGDRIGPTSGAFRTANDFDGLSLRARLRMQDIENQFEDFCPPDVYAANLFFPAWQAGSMIHNNSWGTNGGPGTGPSSYSLETWYTDLYLKIWDFREQVVVFSAGNKGFNFGQYTSFSISDEAHGKNVITVGGSENGNARQQMYRESSRGPTVDCFGGACSPIGRVKPDVVAPGRVETSEAQAVAAYGPFPGTSVAAPAVSGAAALVRDYFAQGKYPNDPTDPPLLLPPSSALVKAMLVNSTVFLSDSSAWQANSIFGLPANAYPNYDQGYGRPVLDNVLEPAGYRELKVWEDASTWASTGSLWGRRVDIQEKWKANCNILRITLAWTDEPMTPGSGIALVNDLDLEVVFNGQTYRGNHRLTGNTFDRYNNVEDVYIELGTVASARVQPLVKVYGRSVSSALPQPFAVVVTYGTCFDNIPCPPLPMGGGGCYRGPQDVVPGPFPPPPACTDQIYGMGEYQSGGGAFPRCPVPKPISDINPQLPVNPVLPVQPNPEPRPSSDG